MFVNPFFYFVIKKRLVCPYVVVPLIYRSAVEKVPMPAPILLGLPAPFVAVSRRFSVIVLIDPVEVKEQLTSYPP